MHKHVMVIHILAVVLFLGYYPKAFTASDLPANAAKDKGLKEIGSNVVKDIKDILKSPFIDFLASSELATWEDIKKRIDEVKKSMQAFEAKYSNEFVRKESALIASTALIPAPTAQKTPAVVVPPPAAVVPASVPATSLPSPAISASPAQTASPAPAVVVQAPAVNAPPPAPAASVASSSASIFSASPTSSQSTSSIFLPSASTSGGTGGTSFSQAPVSSQPSTVALQNSSQSQVPGSGLGSLGITPPPVPAPINLPIAGGIPMK